MLVSSKNLGNYENFFIDINCKDLEVDRVDQLYY